MAKKKIETAVMKNIETPENPKTLDYIVLESFVSNRFYSKGEVIKSDEIITPILNDLLKNKKIKVKK